ncbi:MAG: YdaU family protein [Lautropia sp.]|nr:YdaU family protein [Lautropia sp.]
MNYYPFHIGDYRSHTAHLTLLQDLAYRRLLELYYLHERALPPDPALCARRIGMSMHLEEVQVVLEDFFVLGEDGYRNKRCDEILEKFISQREKAKRAGIESGKARRAWAEHREKARRAGVRAGLSEDEADGDHSVNDGRAEEWQPLGDPSAAGERSPDKSSAASERPLNECSPSVETTNNQKPITKKTYTPLTPLAEGGAPGVCADLALPAQAPPGEQPAPNPPRTRPRRAADPATWSGVMVDRPPEVAPDLWRDFCALRRARSAPLTARALDGVRREAAKVDATLTQALTFMVERGHQGFIVDAYRRGLDGPAPRGRDRAPVRHEFAGIDYGVGGRL